MPTDKDTFSESGASTRGRSPYPLPCLDSMRKEYEKVYHSSECLKFCKTLEKIVDEIDSYDFRAPSEMNQFSINAYSFLDEVRYRYSILKKEEYDAEQIVFDGLIKKWGYATTQKLDQFTPVANKKQKTHSPSKDISSAKKIKTNCENQYEVLTVENLLMEEQKDITVDDVEIPSRTSTPVPHVNPPPPITIDNVTHPASC
ncbi:hypothetical protein TNCV_2133781 [Trichonephila clavipes]|nr:hypothetical protein TNCV_2133781 [Trichonephila clavipes]